MAAGPEISGPCRPRVLVTGFGPFPGAPENPTALLVERLAEASEKLAISAELRAEVLPVEYEAVSPRLAAIGRRFAPDIAVHFGLAARASGFTLERIARNAITAETPDNRGERLAGRAICERAGDLASTLPLAAVHDVLSKARLPVAWSDDAGGYVCNYLFYLSRAHLCPGFKPAMAGFVHVPPLDAGILTLDDLEAGALAAIETCVRLWPSFAAMPEVRASGPTGSP